MAVDTERLIEELDIEEAAERLGIRFGKMSPINSGPLKGDRTYIYCPFHNDKHPTSTMLYAIKKNGKIKKGITCYACGQSWNIINATMEIRKESYFEAVSFLAQTTGGIEAYLLDEPNSSSYGSSYKNNQSKNLPFPLLDGQELNAIGLNMRINDNRRIQNLYQSLSDVSEERIEDVEKITIDNPVYIKWQEQANKLQAKGKSIGILGDRPEESLSSYVLYEKCHIFNIYDLYQNAHYEYYLLIMDKLTQCMLDNENLLEYVKDKTDPLSLDYYYKAKDSQKIYKKIFKKMDEAINNPLNTCKIKQVIDTYQKERC